MEPLTDIERSRRCSQLYQKVHDLYRKQKDARDQAFDLRQQATELKRKIFQVEQSLTVMTVVPQSLSRDPRGHVFGLAVEIEAASKRAQLEGELRLLR